MQGYYRHAMTCYLAPLVAVSIALLTSGTAHSEKVTYVIDPERSQITSSGRVTALVPSLAEQQPGSLTASLGGTLSADFLDGTWTFGGGSEVEALAHPAAPFQPPANDPSDVDNLAAAHPVNPAMFQAAARNVHVDILSGTLQEGGSSAGLEVAFTQGQLDVASALLQLPFDSIDLAATLPTAMTQDAGTIVRSISSGQETLTIPVEVEFVYGAILPDDSLLRLVGEIVAIRELSLLAGDINGDGAVDLQDFSILKTNFGGPGTLAEGDLDGDGQVALSDFTILKEAFGSVAVPEPATAWLAAAAGLICLFLRWRPGRHV